jgi:hypothetical protein
LPDSVSKQLPSRGQVAVRGLASGKDFQTVIEPDGNFGHWIKVDDQLKNAVNIESENEIEFDILPNKEWPEPTIPKDFQNKLNIAPAEVQNLWSNITSMAKWEWVRWINATSVEKTRERRIEVAISKMKSGKRRPCCFNLSGCTDPSVSKNGQLMGINSK